jgi:hypothetical protein
VKVGDLVKITDHRYESLVGLLININENPSPGLDPMPYRVQWVNPPDGYPKTQSLKARWLEVVNASR